MLVKDKDDHKKHKDPKKVFDVVRPGGVPALPTSRPVIMGHKAPVQDDQFMPGAPALRAGDPEAKHDLLDSKNKKAISPVDASSMSGQSSQTETATVPPEHLGPSSESKSSAQTAPSLSSEQAAPTKSQTSEAATTDAEAVAPSNSASSAASRTPEPAAEATASHLETTPAPSRTSGGAFVDAQGTFHEEEPTPAHVAMGQTVQTDIDGQQPGSSASSSAQQPARLKTIDDLLAETGAPELGPDTSPGLIISHHHNKSHALRSSILLFLSIILIAAIILNFLLDADILTANGVWHTNLIN